MPLIQLGEDPAGGGDLNLPFEGLVGGSGFAKVVHAPIPLPIYEGIGFPGRLGGGRGLFAMHQDVVADEGGEVVLAGNGGGFKGDRAVAEIRAAPRFGSQEGLLVLMAKNQAFKKVVVAGFGLALLEYHWLLRLK